MTRQAAGKRGPLQKQRIEKIFSVVTKVPGLECKVERARLFKKENYVDRKPNFPFAKCLHKCLREIPAIFAHHRMDGLSRKVGTVAVAGVALRTIHFLAVWCCSRFSSLRFSKLGHLLMSRFAVASSD